MLHSPALHSSRYTATALKPALCRSYTYIHLSAPRRLVRWPASFDRNAADLVQHVPKQLCRHKRFQHACHAVSDGGDVAPQAALHSITDTNQLQTELHKALAAEDYSRAVAVRDRLKQLLGAASVPTDWYSCGLPEWLADRAERLGFRIPTEVQRRAAAAVLSGGDVILRSETGSGKTLAFMLPMLARLDVPPSLFPDDLRGPQALVIVPFRELGVQHALLAYKLLGGSINPGIPGDAANMFTYKGPKGIKVRGILDSSEVEYAKTGGYIKGVHVVVATPDCIAAACAEPNALPLLRHLKVVVVDEVDACWRESTDNMKAIFAAVSQPHAHDDNGDDNGDGDGAEQASTRPSIVLVGATVDEHLVEEIVQSKWVEEPIVITVGQQRMPAGLQHRYVVVNDDEKLLVLARMMRNDLLHGGDDAAPAHVMVFASSEPQARLVAEPLRNSMWGEHTFAALLPSGEEPVKAMHAFRDNKATLLLVTPRASRGLDLPSVSHVYNLDVPLDKVEYLHRAGRAGRIGSAVGGVVTTLVSEEQLLQLTAMARELGVTFDRVDARAAAAPLAAAQTDLDISATRKQLEDILNLLPSQDDAADSQ